MTVIKTEYLQLSQCLLSQQDLFTALNFNAYSLHSSLYRILIFEITTFYLAYFLSQFIAKFLGMFPFLRCFTIFLVHPKLPF